jgi:hypothetical protein
MDVGYGSHWLYVIVCDLIQSGGTSNFTSAYNQRALYMLCLAEYMCSAMCWPCHVALYHVHIVRSATWSESPCMVMTAVLRPLRLCTHLQLPLAPPTTATLKLLCLIYVENFSALDLYYSNAQLLFLF